MAVQIVFNQSGKPAGVAGQAREDLDLGTPVLAQAVGGPFVSQQWTFIDRPADVITNTNSNAAFTAPSSASTNITPVDQPGTYLIQVAVDSGQGLGATVDDVARLTFYAGPALNADPTQLPRRIPAFGERREHNVPDALSPLGNPQGWAREWRRWFAKISAALAGGGVTPVAITTTGTAVANTSEILGTRAAVLTRTLPDPAPVGTVVEAVDDAELCSAFPVTYAAPGGSTILNATNVAGTQVQLATDGETALFRKVASTRWARVY